MKLPKDSTMIPLVGLIQFLLFFAMALHSENIGLVLFALLTFIEFAVAAILSDKGLLDN